MRRANVRIDKTRGVKDVKAEVVDHEAEFQW